MRVLFTKLRPYPGVDYFGKQMGEEPLHTFKAHVFHIDPESKRCWIQKAQCALDVGIYHDNARNLYRILAMDCDKVLINSTLTPVMIFSKTSQKFGQWTDNDALQTYGLGFQSECDLQKFARCFNELKCKLDLCDTGIGGYQCDNMADQLRYENDRLKIALNQSSMNARKWETELHLLRNTNLRLSAAIQESSTNVDVWNQQLSCLKGENARLKLKVLEMERTVGSCCTLEAQLREVMNRLTCSENLLSQKDEELVDLKMKIDNLQQVDVACKRTKVQCQMAEEENIKLKDDILDLHDKVQNLNLHKDARTQELKDLQAKLSTKVAELKEIGDKMSELI